LGIPTGTLTEADKYDLMQTNAISRIDETGGQARKTEETKQTNREDMQDRRAWTLGIRKNPETGADESVLINAISGEVKPVVMNGKNVGSVSKPSSTGAKPETARNINDRQFNAASQLKNTDPELGKFIHIGQNGPKDVTIDPPKEANYFGYGAGPTPKQFKKINDTIYGIDTPAINQPTRTGATPPTTESNIPNIPKGRVVVQDKNGKKFHLPIEQLQEAIKQGYTEVK
jgi:hypothetical protein